MCPRRHQPAYSSSISTRTQERAYPRRAGWPALVAEISLRAQPVAGARINFRTGDVYFDLDRVVTKLL